MGDDRQYVDPHFGISPGPWDVTDDGESVCIVDFMGQKVAIIGNPFDANYILTGMKSFRLFMNAMTEFRNSEKTEKDAEKLAEKLEEIRLYAADLLNKGREIWIRENQGNK